MREQRGYDKGKPFRERKSENDWCRFVNNMNELKSFG